MTKYEATESGRNDGIFYANGKPEEWLRSDKAQVVADIATAAMSDALHHGFRSLESSTASAYLHAYKLAALAGWGERYHALPDVKAALVVSATRRHVEQVLELAADTLSRWTVRLAADPGDAFSWSESAMKDAARRDVYTVVRTIMDAVSVDDVEHRRDAVAAAVRDCRERAFSYALNGHHSTSVVSNLMAEYRAAAQAEFVAFVDRRFE